jgi:hypothetical protein
MYDEDEKFIILVAKFEEEKSLGRHRHIWDVNMKINLRLCEKMD